jgi:hypothetical protein
MANKTDEILDMMLNIQTHLFDKRQLTTNIRLVTNLYRSINTIIGSNKLIRPYLQINQRSQERVFFPYSPDIAVFLQKASLVIEDPCANPEKSLQAYIKMYGTIPSIIGTYYAIYIIGSSMEVCHSTYEILMAYYTIPISSKPLTEDDYNALVNWDKEKARKA